MRSPSRITSAKPSIAKEACHGVANHNRCAQERECNHQTDATSPKKLAKPASCVYSALLEVLVNRLAKHRCFSDLPGASLEVDQQCQPCVTRQITRPFDDEFFRTRV